MFTDDWVRRESRREKGYYYYWSPALGISQEEPPYPWQQRTSRSKPVCSFYWNVITGESCFEKPVITPLRRELPYPWVELLSRSEPVAVYYFNAATGETTFDRPSSPSSRKDVLNAEFRELKAGRLKSIVAAEAKVRDEAEALQRLLAHHENLEELQARQLADEGEVQPTAFEHLREELAAVAEAKKVAKAQHLQACSLRDQASQRASDEYSAAEARVLQAEAKVASAEQVHAQMLAGMLELKHVVDAREQELRMAEQADASARGALEAVIAERANCERLLLEAEVAVSDTASQLREHVVDANSRCKAYDAELRLAYGIVEETAALRDLPYRNRLHESDEADLKAFDVASETAAAAAADRLERAAVRVAAIRNSDAELARQLEAAAKAATTTFKKRQRAPETLNREVDRARDVAKLSAAKLAAAVAVHGAAVDAHLFLAAQVDGPLAQAVIECTVELTDSKARLGALERPLFILHSHSADALALRVLENEELKLVESFKIPMLAPQLFVALGWDARSAEELLASDPSASLAPLAQAPTSPNVSVRSCSELLAAELAIVSDCVEQCKTRESELLQQYEDMSLAWERERSLKEVELEKAVVELEMSETD